MSSPTPAASGAVAPLRAPLFAALIARLRAADRCVVLDLGAAQAGTIALLNEFRCRLDIADLGASLERLAAEHDPDELDTLIESLLPRPREPADAVLCWDLLNYLPRPALGILLEHTAARSRPGTLVHALIAYSSARMPAQPGQYAAMGETQLAPTAPGAAERAAPRYTPQDLARCLPGYHIERAMLLRNGMQEFLFRLK